MLDIVKKILEARFKSKTNNASLKITLVLIFDVSKR